VKLVAFSLGVCAALSSVAQADSDDDMGRRVQALLRMHQAEVFGCVAKQAGAVEGEALLRVVVGASPGAGASARQVELLKVEPDRGVTRAVAECVAAAARSWDLSSLRAGDGDQVVFPLAFKPEPPGAANVAVQARMRKLRWKKGERLVSRINGPTAWYVVSGAVRYTLGRETVRAAKGDVVYAVGEGTVEHLAEAATEIVVVAAPAQPGTDARLVLRAAASTAALPIAEGKGEVRLYLDGVAAPFSLERLCANKGLVVPRHEHTSDELLYIISGRGETTLGDRAEVESAGEIVTIPRGTPHALRVDQALCAVQVYAPAGPEQRFKQQPQQQNP